MLSFCWSQNLRNSALSFFRASPTSLQWHSRCFSWSNSSADEKRRLTIWSLSHLVWTALTTVTRSTSETKQTRPQRTLKATNKVDPTLWLFSCCWLMIYFPVLPKEPPSHLAEDQQIRLKSRFPPPKSLMLLIQDSPLSSQSVAAQCYFTQVIPPPPALRSHPPAFWFPNPCSFFSPPCMIISRWRRGVLRVKKQIPALTLKIFVSMFFRLSSHERRCCWSSELSSPFLAPTVAHELDKDSANHFSKCSKKQRRILWFKFLQWGTLSNKQKRSIHLQCKKLTLGYREMWSHKHLHNVSTAHFVYRYK